MSVTESDILSLEIKDRIFYTLIFGLLWTGNGSEVYVCVWLILCVQFEEQCNGKKLAVNAHISTLNSKSDSVLVQILMIHDLFGIVQASETCMWEGFCFMYVASFK